MALLIDTAGMNAYQGTCALADDDRGYPEQDQLVGTSQAIMSEFLDMIIDTALEDHIRTIAESLIGGVQSAIIRLTRDLDKATDKIKGLTRDFDGSEIMDVELHEATLTARRIEAAVTAIEMVRDTFAETYTVVTGEVWTPWKGSAGTSGATASLIDARDALKARRAKQQGRADVGENIIVFRGAKSANTDEDRVRIWSGLDRLHAKHLDMSLALTGSDGADKIAMMWAKAKHVRLVLVKVEFDRLGKAAPFRANDMMLELEPILVVTMPQSLNKARAEAHPPSGPILNMAQKSQKAGISTLVVTAA